MAYLALKSTLVMQTRTGLPEDRVVWDFVTRPQNTDPADDAFIVATAIDNFLSASPATTEISSWVGDCMSRDIGADHVYAYEITDLSGATPTGPPINDYPITLAGAAGSDVLPTEVAVCLSYHADLTGIVEESGSTRPASRRRGRIFVGPLIGEAVELVPDVHTPVVSSLLQQDLAVAAGAFLDELAASSIEWVVWSRAGSALYNVVGGWVDDAFDTQRRRGQDPNLRINWPV